MSLSLTLPNSKKPDFPDLSPRIVIMGVGGGGVNAVNNMIRAGLMGVEFCVANTDAQSLSGSLAENRIQLGVQATAGQGAGAKPEIGRQAAEEQLPEIMQFLAGADMVFIATGMGGGTGTGATPVIARAASEAGLLTVGVVTKPFTSEGPRRMRQAELGINDLQNFVDSLIVIPNQNLFRLTREDLTVHQGYELADNVLMSGIRAITEAISNPGLVNLDFADVRSIMSERGRAKIGIGEAEGENRALRAAEAAISNPLLEDTQLRGAKALLINVLGGPDLKLSEVDEIYSFISNGVEGEPNIIPGSSFDNEMEGKIRVYVVATGIDAPMGLDARRVNLTNVTPLVPRRQEAIDVPAMTQPLGQSLGQTGAQPGAQPAAAAAAPRTHTGYAAGQGQGHQSQGQGQGHQGQGQAGPAGANYAGTPSPSPRGAGGGGLAGHGGQTAAVARQNAGVSGAAGHGQRISASAVAGQTGPGSPGHGSPGGSGDNGTTSYGHATPASHLGYSQTATARKFPEPPLPSESQPAIPSENQAAARNIGAKIAAPVAGLRGGSLMERVTSAGRKPVPTEGVTKAPPASVNPNQASASDDNSLDIPAFLRRQAN